MANGAARAATRKAATKIRVATRSKVIWVRTGNREPGTGNLEPGTWNLYRSQVFGNVVDVMLGVDGGHAAAARGGDRLAVDVVLHVAAREYAGDARLRAVVRDQVAVLIHLELTAEQ